MEATVTFTQTLIFFLMLILGWIIYLLMDLGAMNQATPFISPKETVRVYWRVNSFEIIASVIVLFSLTLLYMFREFQFVLDIMGLEFKGGNEAPLGFAFLLGINVKAFTVLLRKLKSPLKLDKGLIKDPVAEPVAETEMADNH